MTDNDLVKRIESLEARTMHQDASIDELTRTLLAQEELLKKHTEVLKGLEERLSGLDALSPGASTHEPPPHY